MDQRLRLRLRKTVYLLRIVWEWGPCCNAAIAREAGMTAEDCYRAVYHLRMRGLIERTGPRLYDITPKGVRLLSGDRMQRRLRLGLQ